jgi:BASS family bile acid:Na+ symporter
MLASLRTAIDILIPGTVFCLMILVGLGLKGEDFKQLIQSPKAILVGIIGQVVLLPIMAFLYASLFTENLTLQIGIILLAACPGGPLSNSLVYLAKARIELSVTLTAINGMLALVSTPLIASLGIRLFAGEHTDIRLPLLRTIAQIFILAVLPVLIGMTIRAKASEFALRYETHARIIAFILLVSHISLVVLTNIGIVGKSLSIMFIPGVVFCLLALLVGYIAAMISGLDRDTRFTISIEVGLQNVVIAILISYVLLKRPEFALFVLNYATAVVLIMLPWVYIYRRRWSLSHLWKKMASILEA